MDPAEIAARLREIAEYLDLDADPHRARAYRRAATSVELAPDFDRLLATGRLTSLPGIGPALEGAIRLLAHGGTLRIHERLRARWPAVTVELARLPAIGAVRARKLALNLQPRSLEEVAELCERGIVRTVPGFGKVSERRILEAIRERDSTSPVLLLPQARQLSAALVAHLRGEEAVEEIASCGPLRRWEELVDHLAIAVATRNPQAVHARLRRHPLVSASSAEGGSLFRGRLRSGLPIELHHAPPERFGVALVRATGSAVHLSNLDELARRRGQELVDLPAANEEAVYRALGLAWLPPEVRDGTDELEAARHGPLHLVTLEDVTGAVHCHTDASDGKNTLAEMAAAARERHLDFLTVTDHSASATYAHGLDAERLRAQRAEIDAMQRTAGIRLLHGTEADILADGSLDWPLDELERLDVVIASIHRRHRLDERAMTDRLVAAMRQPCFKIWGHPLGRMLLRRPAIACRFEEVVDAICASDAAIELNGDPHRMDLEPALARSAARRGVKFVLASDAHSCSGLENLQFAVAIARRARLAKTDVLNTLPADEFQRLVRPQRSGKR